MGVLDQRFEKNFMITSVDYVFNWARKSAIWPLTFGLACCAIEMIASTTSRFDMARLGPEVVYCDGRMLKRGRAVQRVFGLAGRGSHRTSRCVRCRMPAAAGRPFLRALEVAGQDRPDDAGEAGHGSASAATDGRRVQKGSDGGANAGATIGARKRENGK